MNLLSRLLKKLRRTKTITFGDSDVQGTLTIKGNELISLELMISPTAHVTESPEALYRRLTPDEDIEAVKTLNNFRKLFIK